MDNSLKTPAWLTQANLQLQVQTLGKQLQKILAEHYRLTISLIQALLAAWFFLVIGFKSLFISLPFFSQRYFGILILGLAVSFSLLAALIYKQRWWESLSIWIQSGLLTFYSFAYYLRISFTEFKFLNLDLNTGLVFIPLIMLIFLVNWNLFDRDSKKVYLLVLQIFVIIGQTFSFLNLLQADRTEIRAFSQDWLTTIFKLNNIYWLFLSSLSIALLSILSFKLVGIKKNLGLLVVFFVLCSQVILLIYNFNNFTYWYKTLLFVVFWDYIFNPFYTIASKISDPKFRPKLIISTFYHFILFLIILFSATYYNLVSNPF